MVFSVPSKVNIRNISEVHESLLTFVNNNTEITLDLDTCDDADLSLIQLVEAVRVTAAVSGKSVSLAKPANGTVQTILTRSGVMESLSAEDTLFWLHKEIH